MPAVLVESLYVNGEVQVITLVLVVGKLAYVSFKSKCLFTKPTTLKIDFGEKANH